MVRNGIWRVSFAGIPSPSSVAVPFRSCHFAAAEWTSAARSTQCLAKSLAVGPLPPCRLPAAAASGAGAVVITEAARWSSIPRSDHAVLDATPINVTGAVSSHRHFLRFSSARLSAPVGAVLSHAMGRRVTPACQAAGPIRTSRTRRHREQGSDAVASGREVGEVARPAEKIHAVTQGGARRPSAGYQRHCSFCEDGVRRWKGIASNCNC